MTTKDHLQKEFYGIIESAKIRSNEVLEESLRVIKRKKQHYNDQVIKEMESHLTEVQSNYDSGFIEIGALLLKQIELRQNALLELYPDEEVKYIP